jgi:hypothetical protein
MRVRNLSMLLCAAFWPLTGDASAQVKKTSHWAFEPVKDVAPPSSPLWGRNPVDAFIQAKQRTADISPNPEAERRILIRRLSLDLTGLPPSAEDVEEFEKDRRANAYELLVERLLTAPRHGERWARHWLDVARWAESEGYESNHPRNFAWRYRDWVVNAFNADKPFADFIREQIAGDEIEPYADDNLIATGFLASCRLSSNEEDRYRQRNEIGVDIANATASAFLGLTLQCAQCHNHRLDPISARDYYRFYAFFTQGLPANIALKDPALWAAYNAKKPAGYDAARRERDEIFERGKRIKLDGVRAGLSSAAKNAYEKSPAARDADEERTAREADLLFQFTLAMFETAIPAAERKRYELVKKQVADMEKDMLEPPQTFGFFSFAKNPHRLEVLPMKAFYPLMYDDHERARFKARVLRSGDVHQPLGEVDIGWPAVLGPTPPDAQQPRTELAKWLASPDNPLVARVFVNRLWQWHFGRGLVETASDFGLKGAPPTHPELLDWLAGELQRTGSIRHIHRLIVTSSVYRQSAAANAKNEAIDPDNKTRWRWEPRRLEAEAVRDVLLAASGELDRKIGGPSVVGKDDAPRRALYLFQKRDVPQQQAALFDGPVAASESCAVRRVTTVPLQALYLLNSDFSLKRTEALARRVRQQTSDREEQISAAFRIVLQRSPDDEERSLARQAFERLGDSPTALTRFCQALLNLNEFLYLE